MKVFLLVFGLSAFVALGLSGPAYAEFPCYSVGGANLVDFAGDLLHAEKEGTTKDVKIEIAAGGICKILHFSKIDSTLDLGAIITKSSPMAMDDDGYYRVGPGIGLTYDDSVSLIMMGAWDTAKPLFNYHDYEVRVFVSTHLSNIYNTIADWFSDGVQDGINKSLPNS